MNIKKNMDFSKNKYIQAGSKYALGLSGIAVAFMTFRIFKRSFVQRHLEKSKETLRKFISDEDIQELLKDEEYFDILARLAEFGSLDPVNFRNIVKSVRALLIFFDKVKSDPKITMTHAYEYVHHAQLVIEQVRLMRAYLELAVPSCLDDFDDIAVEIQTKYEQDNEAILMDAQLGY